MRRAAASLLALGVILVRSSASADVHDRNAISYEPFAILSRGLVLQYERMIVPRVSVVAGAGARFAARDDFSSETWLGKGEGRYWLKRDAGMTGAYFGFQQTVSRTSLESRRYDRSIGAYWQVEESIRFGYRFVIFGFQEITPSLGLSMVHELDERGILAPVTQATGGMSLSIGWMF